MNDEKKVHVLQAQCMELLETLRFAESVYRKNIVQPGEPSSVLDAMQLAIASAERNIMLFPPQGESTMEQNLPHFTIDNKPEECLRYRKAAMVDLHFVEDPFVVETQEGPITIDKNSEGWDGGYFVAYPSDGSKPYPMSPKYKRDNYVVADEDDDPEWLAGGTD